MNSNVVISQGLIGSNGAISVGGSVNMLGAEGGGAFSTGANGVINGDLVFGGNLSLGGSTNLFGNADSGGNITLLGNNAIIHANATAAGSITLGGGASAVTGTSTPFGSPATFMAAILPSAMTFTGGGTNQSVAGGGTLTLAPGIYGSLTTGTSATINLSSGTYVFDSVGLGGGNRINYTVTGGGAVHILVVGNVSTGSNLTTFLNGQTFANADPALIAKVYAESHGTWLLGGGGEWLGTIFTPYSNLTFNNNVDIRGQVVSGAGLTLSGSGHIVSFIPSEQFAVPEPASFGLVAIGLIVVACLRR